MFKTYYCTRTRGGEYEVVERIKKPVWLWMLSAIVFLIPVANLTFYVLAMFMIYQDFFVELEYDEILYVRIKHSKFLDFFTKKI